MKNYFNMLFAIIYLLLFYDYFFTEIKALNMFNSTHLNEIIEGTILLLFTFYGILFLIKFNQKLLFGKNVIPLLIVTILMTVLCTSVILLASSDEKVVKQRFALRSRKTWSRTTYISKKSYRSALTSNAKKSISFEESVEQTISNQTVA